MSKDEPRLTAPTIKVLGMLVTSSPMELSGAEIAEVTKLASGTLYPILFRLERAGWVESRWETDNPSELGRPRRRFYQLTGIGVKKARSALREISSAIRGFAWR
jgi:PadR family transcriptional regulator, regulatory protein PadR